MIGVGCAGFSGSGARRVGSGAGGGPQAGGAGGGRLGGRALIAPCQSSQRMKSISGRFQPVPSTRRRAARTTAATTGENLWSENTLFLRTVHRCARAWIEYREMPFCVHASVSAQNPSCGCSRRPDINDEIWVVAVILRSWRRSDLIAWVAVHHVNPCGLIRRCEYPACPIACPACRGGQL